MSIYESICLYVSIFLYVSISFYIIITSRSPRNGPRRERRSGGGPRRAILTPPFSPDGIESGGTPRVCSRLLEITRKNAGPHSLCSVSIIFECGICVSYRWLIDGGLHACSRWDRSELWDNTVFVCTWPLWIPISDLVRMVRASGSSSMCVRYHIDCCRYQLRGEDFNRGGERVRTPEGGSEV